MPTLTVNIAEYPVTWFPYQGENVLAVHGDAHANVVKVIFFLLSVQAIELSEPLYLELVGLYRDLSHDPIPAIEVLILLRMKEIIRSITLSDHPVPVLHVGDLLADRGENCYLIHLLLNHLRTSGDRSSIILQSNHDTSAQQFFHNYTLHPNVFIKSGAVAQGRSLIKYRDLMTSPVYGVLAPHRAKSMYHTSYLPQLQILHCTQRGNEVTLFTHAPVPIDVIKRLAWDLRVPYTDASADSFFDMCQRIQNAFVERVNTDGLAFTHSQNPRSVYFQLLWNRPERDKAYSLKIVRGIGFNFRFVHGHHYSSHYKNSENVDTSVGKYNTDQAFIGNWNFCFIAYDRQTLYYDPKFAPKQTVRSLVAHPMFHNKTKETCRGSVVKTCKKIWSKLFCCQVKRTQDNKLSAITPEDERRVEASTRNLGGGAVLPHAGVPMSIQSRDLIFSASSNELDREGSLSQHSLPELVAGSNSKVKI